MKVAKASQKFEAWLGRQTPLIKADLRRKHQSMAADPFSFLRATFYRWAQHWPKVCAGEADGPEVLAVGDLHIENFGTWRDAEGRLAWGVNDFDEAFPLAYANDLVRLTTSTLLGIRTKHLGMAEEEACDAILEGYQQGMESGGRPFIIEENHRWFAPLIDQQARDPAQFWNKLRELPAVSKQPPRDAMKALLSMLPEPGLRVTVSHRVAGLGSLGKQRFLALGEWHGGTVAREAKAITASACLWAQQKRRGKIYYSALMSAAVRCPDPLFAVRRGWIVRRISPECNRVELTSLPKPHDDTRLLHAMGWETANIHAASQRRIKPVLRDLKKRPPHWLRKAASAMLDVTMEDWTQWRHRMAGEAR